jgi:hypothetical protein
VRRNGKPGNDLTGALYDGVKGGGLGGREENEKMGIGMTGEREEGGGEVVRKGAFFAFENHDGQAVGEIGDLEKKSTLRGESFCGISKSDSGIECFTGILCGLWKPQGGNGEMVALF